MREALWLEGLQARAAKEFVAGLSAARFAQDDRVSWRANSFDLMARQEADDDR